MAPMAASLMVSMAFSLINAITRQGAMRSGIWQEGGFIPLLALP